MKRSFLIFVIFLFVNVTFSQSNWVNKTIYNVKDYKNFKDLKFIDPTTGYTSNANKIYKTTDGGLSWFSIPFPSPDTISAIYYYDQTIIYAAYANTLYRTTNSGNSWDLMHTFPVKPVNIYFNTLKGFVNSKNVIYRTINGGNDWDTLSYPPGFQNQTNIYLNENIFFSYTKDSVGTDASKLLQTSNGGLNWTTSIDMNNFDGSKIQNLKFIDQNLGILVTGYLNSLNPMSDLFITTDGGINWNRKAYVINYYKNVSISNANNIDVISSDSYLYHSSNGGTTFNKTYFNSYLSNIMRTGSSSERYLCGEYNTLYKSSDATSSFTDISSSSNCHFNLNSISFLNEMTGFAVGERGAILKTTNGGNNFFNTTNQNGVLTDGANYNYINFFNQNEGVIGDGNSVKITSDGGATWNSINLPPGVVRKAVFNDKDHGLILLHPSISYDKVYLTTNGGLNWNKVLSDTTLSDSHFYETDRHDEILLTTNKIFVTRYLSSGSYCGPGCWSTYSGNNILFRNFQATTTSISPSAGTSWTNISFLKSIDNQIVYSTSGHLMYTVNNGDNWIEANTNTMPKISYGLGNDTYYALNGINSPTDYTCNNYRFQKTYNIGNSWYPADTLSLFSPRQIYFANSNVGFIIGNGGMILKTTNGGSVFAGNSDVLTPEKFNLEQNYPNPFNPVTKINFSLPSASRISLKVYDMLGKEVAALVNSELRNAGSYSINFDGSKLSSGVYFYKLINEDNSTLSITRKMMLVK